MVQEYTYLLRHLMGREHEETRIVSCSAMHECLSVGSIEQLSAYRPGRCHDTVGGREWRLRVRIYELLGYARVIALAQKLPVRPQKRVALSGFLSP